MRCQFGAEGAVNAGLGYAEVRSDETGKKIAFFRCTQMILWSKG
ncbi:MAG: hypothetical protein ACI8PB_005153 [Desulforhopalus sp.]|jgi:hypothetical protein